MNIEFLKHFDKDIDDIKLENIKKDIISTIENVENAKNIKEIKNLKKLVGYKFAYRIKINAYYRIGIFIENNTVQFARIVHRKDIYKVFP